MSKTRLATFAVFMGLACAPAACAYTSIFAFGDSLFGRWKPVCRESEGAIPLAPYVAGHFSNGPTWVEDLSPNARRLCVLKSFLTSANGTNYAFGGAQRRADRHQSV